MLVADRLIALVEEGVVGDLLLVDICLNLHEGLVGERVDLDDAALVVDLDDANVAALAALRLPPARRHGRHLELGIGTLQRLYLGNPVV